MNKKLHSFKSLALAVLVFSTSNAIAQVPLNGIVEHFTNTNCGVCASRNPMLIANLASYPNVSLISMHPSSPFPSCLLSMQNVTDNNARTNFYSIFGGTPRIVVNGTVIANSTSYSTASLFSGLGALTSDYSMTVTSSRFMDSITNRVVIRKMSNVNSYVGANLFLGAVEDTVTYTGGNGEPRHYNVLRKTIQAAQAVTLPANIGDSVVLNPGTLQKSNIWNWSRMRVAAILLDNNKKLIQSRIQVPIIGVLSPFSLEQQEEVKNLSSDINSLLSVYPNPSNGTLNIKSLTTYPIQAQLTSILGHIVPLTIDANGTHTIQNLAKGLYILSAKTNTRTIGNIRIMVQ